MRKQGLPREKVLATIARLLDTTLIRVGNDEYAKSNDSYGLTTLKDRHATVRGDELRFIFTGKSRQELEAHAEGQTRRGDRESGAGTAWPAALPIRRR